MAQVILARAVNQKSDDVVGRVKTYEAIVKGENIPNQVFQNPSKY